MACTSVQVLVSARVRGVGVSDDVAGAGAEVDGTLQLCLGGKPPCAVSSAAHSLFAALMDAITDTLESLSVV